MATLNPPLAHRWQVLCDEIQHPDVELTVEEFAALLSVYKLMRADGHEFDPAVVALMTCLEQQARWTDDNMDMDGADDDSIGARGGVV